MVLIGQPRRIAIYARVSTRDQDCARQVKELQEYAQTAKFQIAGIFKETASGAKNNRSSRAKVIKLAQARKIDAILVSELTRWGRSTIDLITTLQELASWDVSVIAVSGFQFDLSTAQGKLIAGIMASLAEFERDLVRERVKSGLAAAKARGKKLGRQPGQNIKADKLAPKVKHLLSEGHSYRSIARKLKCSPTTVSKIVKNCRERQGGD